MAKKSNPVKITKPSNSDDHLGHEIKIKCKTSDTASLDELVNFQGKLKKLSEESYLRLKSSILDLGFSFPVFVWKDRNKMMIIDAHQRVECLKRMRTEGYIIPQLPIVWIEAMDKKEAAKMVLAATSQYGEVQVDGLHSFMEEFKLEMPDLVNAFKFPEVDFESFQLTYFHKPAPPVVIGESIPAAVTAPPHILRPAGNPSSPPQVAVSPTPSSPVEHWKGMPEFAQGDETSFRHVIVHFVDEAGVKEFFKAIGQKDTGKTKSVWFPPQERMDTESKRYTDK